YLNEFLNFSRGTKLKLKLTDFESYLTGIIMIVKHSFPTDIRIVKKKEVIPRVMIDQEQLRQVLVNFLSNSRDALNGAASPACEVILDYNKKELLITVKDNGCGIKAGDLKDIFVPFFTTKETGLGIGLSISKSIVKKHGGRICVKSRAGAGAQFTMAIPLGSKGKIK
ncbi:MAG: HAMP domain-containing sensor histidine kinase, partial [Candidatus Goldiibacteriota bacterium]